MSEFIMTELMRKDHINLVVVNSSSSVSPRIILLAFPIPAKAAFAFLVFVLISNWNIPFNAHSRLTTSFHNPFFQLPVVYRFKLIE
jgi:hypothetical protein